MRHKKIEEMQALILDIMMGLTESQDKAKQSKEEARDMALHQPQYLNEALEQQAKDEQEVHEFQTEFRRLMDKLARLRGKKKLVTVGHCIMTMQQMEESAARGADWWYKVFCKEHFEAKALRQAAEQRVMVKEVRESTNRAFSETDITAMERLVKI